jgi:DnaJ-domain-containing protein 1
MDSVALFFFKDCLKSEGDDCTEFYRRLDVDKKATQEEIRKAYRKASLANHPDKLAQ